MPTDLWAFEKAMTAKGYSPIAGVDEAGRGPLAGPVVAAAVILPPLCADPGIIDSKQLPPRRRDTLYEWIYAHAVAVGIGIVDAIEIDRINILHAARLSMAMALANLRPQPAYVLVDGNLRIAAAAPQQSLVHGDARSVSIAAASIVAKVSRDRLMDGYHQHYPQFGFDRHKGYPTATHRATLAAHGPCPIHRRTFRGVREHLPALRADQAAADAQC